MSTCRCRKIRLDKYEGMTNRQKAATAARDGDWRTVRECFDKHAERAKSVVDSAETALAVARNEKDKANARAVSARKRADKYRAKMEEAQKKVDEVLNMSGDEKFEEAVKREVDKRLDRERRDRELIARELHRTVSTSTTTPWNTSSTCW